jgi:hypothetical protein
VSIDSALSALGEPPRSGGQALNGQNGVGPRGGDLLNPNLAHPEARNAPLNTRAVEGGLALHRFVDTAAQGLLNEQAWHRMAAYMLLAGRTNSEIALAANVTVSAVSCIRAQRWFQDLQVTIANESGEATLGLLHSEVLESIETIVRIRDNPDSGVRARLTAATTLLEHAHGKPIQKIVSNISHSVAKSPADEMAEIQQELAALRARESQTIEIK